MLCGFAPFEDGDTRALFEKIKSCRYDFDQAPWDSVSPDAKDFIRSILVTDADQRLNAESMVMHPWLSKSQCSASLKVPLNKVDNKAVFDQGLLFI